VEGQLPDLAPLVEGLFYRDFCKKIQQSNGR